MFFNVLLQVGILLILIFLGLILTKLNIINEDGSKVMTDLVLYVVTPCVIVKSFIRAFDLNAAKGLVVSVVAAVAAHTAFILLSMLAIHSKNMRRERVLRFAAIFGNCGFMALPLEEALLGADGVFYGSSVVAVFNMFVWSYGVLLMSGNKKYIRPKALVLSPSIIAILLGTVIFLFSLPVPLVVKQPIELMSGLNTPLPMIIIGYHLAKSDILKGIRDKSAVYVSFLKLVAFPVLALFIMYVCGIRGTMLISLTIAFSSPIAAITAMFSAKFENDIALAATMVSMSHLLCILTMPPIVYLAQILA